MGTEKFYNGIVIVETKHNDSGSVSYDCRLTPQGDDMIRDMSSKEASSFLLGLCANIRPSPISPYFDMPIIEYQEMMAFTHLTTVILNKNKQEQ